MGKQMTDGNRGLAGFLAALLAAAALLCGCDPAVVLLSADRDFALDVPNAVFNPVDAAAVADRGLGVSTITFTFGLSTGDVTETVDIADLDPAYRYTRIPVPISGNLTSITATAAGSAHGDFSATLAPKDGEDWGLTGWNAFGNLMKAKLDFILDSVTPAGSVFRLLPCPRAGPATVKYDSGVTASALTDRGTSLTSGQIALEIGYAENPTGMDVDVYTAVVDVDFRDGYYTDILANTYPNDPWDDDWTFEEITATGRRILGTTYTLKRYNAEAWDAADPMYDGRKSGLIDLGGTPGAVGKYLLVGMILRHGTLSAPMHVQCIPIR